MIKKALVTGANGFVGQILIEKLQTEQIAVRALVRKPAQFAHPVETFTLDLTADWTSNPCNGVDTVFHLAGKAHALSEVAADDAQYRQINTEGTRRLLEAAKQAGVERFIFFSTVKAVGDSATRQDETQQSLPTTPYGLSKREAEELVLHGGYVPHPVVIRPCMIYGNTTKGNLPRMIQAVLRGFFPPLPEVNNHRSMVHVADVVEAAWLAANQAAAAGQCYIVSDGQAYSTRQLYEWICQAVHKKPLPFSIPQSVLALLAKIGDNIGQWRGQRFLFDSDSLEKLLGSAWYSSAKIETELAFKASYTLQQSLPEIVSYLQNKSAQTFT